MDEEFVSFAETSIRQYLGGRPGSADTLEGVHQWWIAWQGMPQSPAVTAAALQHLEQVGFMESLRIGNRRLWRKKRD